MGCQAVIFNAKYRSSSAVIINVCGDREGIICTSSRKTTILKSLINNVLLMRFSGKMISI